MNFISVPFFIFLVLLFLLFVLCKPKYKQPLLLIASYLFYATWSIPFIGVILITTSIDYWCTQQIEKAQSTTTKKQFLWLAIIINLFILGYFKYTNFFLSSGHNLCQYLGFDNPLPESLSIILPLGISFYTFEAIGYLVDVYRGKPSAKNWRDYNFYIMYFPHLISGPIIRYQELAEQYGNLLQFPDKARFQKAIELIILGVVFKVTIADMAAVYADPVFTDPKNASTFLTYLGVLAFTVQIYFDFMGYTHIARGASLLFNLELPLNFNHPYLATNISNFWERWHISLSRWIRDYLYIPLGGSRKGNTRTVTNLLATMLIAGAWHGAGWTYIVWGGLHGIYLALYHVYKQVRQHTLSPDSIETLLNHQGYKLTSVMFTFSLVVIGWVFFRATSFEDAQHILFQLTQLQTLPTDITQIIELKKIASLPAFLVLLTCCFSGPWVAQKLSSFYNSLGFTPKAVTVTVALILCWILHADTLVPFIYFQF